MADHDHEAKHGTGNPGQLAVGTCVICGLPIQWDGEWSVWVTDVEMDAKNARKDAHVEWCRQVHEQERKLPMVDCILPAHWIGGAVGETGRGYGHDGGTSGRPCVSAVSVPAARLRAMVKLLGPEEMTPTATRFLLEICNEYDGKGIEP